MIVTTKEGRIKTNNGINGQANTAQDLYYTRMNHCRLMCKNYINSISNTGKIIMILKNEKPEHHSTIIAGMLISPCIPAWEIWTITSEIRKKIQATETHFRTAV